MTRTHCKCGAELWQGECLERQCEDSQEMLKRVGERTVPMDLAEQTLDFPITERELSALSFALRSEIIRYNKIKGCSPTPSNNPTYLETLTKVVNRVDRFLKQGV